MTVEQKNIGRWTIAGAGTILMLCLGTVYAWSFFQNPLVKTYSWSNVQVAWIFSLAIFFLGVSAAWGGIRLPRIGPKKMAILGGVLFGGGYLIAGLALYIHFLPLLYIGYGVTGGIGLGLGYVTPVATVAKWFPDKKGFATGMVIMGFGFGALLMSKVLAPILLQITADNIPLTFMVLGLGFTVITVVSASFLRNPPPGYAPVGWKPAEAPLLRDSARQDADGGTEKLNTGAYLVSGQFVLMWIMFFCNITAGIAIISFQSPMIQSLLRSIRPEMDTAALAAAGGTLIAVSSIFNGLGRFFWGSLSDKLGRIRTFRVMLGSQIGVFVLLVLLGNPWIFGALICYVLLCYGGGFGCMPSFVMDKFGPKLMTAVYGVILTAWAAGGIVGPQLFAMVKDRVEPARAPGLSFMIGGGFLVLGLILSFMIDNAPVRPKTT